MALENERLLDETGWHILEALQENARLSFSELGQRVGLSSPAVSERVRRMEDAGIITGYRAEVNTAKIGYPITAVIRVSNSPGERCTRLSASTQAIPEVLECYRVTGSDSLIMKVMASSVEHLESLIDRISEHGQLTTSIVLSTVLNRKAITRPKLDAHYQTLETIA
ncbi:MAG TPA: Lrp/AsnC family transcriptional regulator [Ktedonobacteraceae bacterium]|nr:Lrp/AsnC family transcriptional regulator [Ktedonobacteraceae bacterium]